MQINGPITQVQFAKYVMGVLPAAALINFVWVLLSCALLVPWTLLPLLIWVSQIIGFSMFFGGVGSRWVRVFVLNDHGNRVPWHLAIGIPIGFFVGCEITRLLLDFDVHVAFHQYGVYQINFVTLICIVLASTYYVLRWRLAGERWRVERAERTSVEARLRALQAQVEPHFLFNTLANVDALISQSPETARDLIRSLDCYLESSLSHARAEKSTLAEELAVLRAYLNIMMIRLPNRLSVSIDCPSECLAVSFPPMLLQPIVENAIRHGIEPALDGGEIHISASEQNGLLTIHVRDSGVGFGNAPVSVSSNGTGLSNVRDRLAVLFGNDASLAVMPSASGGTNVQLAVPYRPVSNDF